jgi:hypothetical protein
MSERAVQTLIAVAEPMFKDLVERQRRPIGIRLPGMNARVARPEDDGGADFDETSELFPHDLDGAVGNPNDVISHLESFTSDAGPGTGERLVADEERRFL